MDPIFYNSISSNYKKLIDYKKIEHYFKDKNLKSPFIIKNTHNFIIKFKYFLTIIILILLLYS